MNQLIQLKDNLLLPVRPKNLSTEFHACDKLNNTDNLQLLSLGYDRKYQIHFFFHHGYELPQVQFSLVISQIFISENVVHTEQNNK